MPQNYWATSHNDLRLRPTLPDFVQLHGFEEGRTIMHPFPSYPAQETIWSQAYRLTVTEIFPNSES